LIGQAVSLLTAQGPVLLDKSRSSAPRDSVENRSLVRLSRSLHTLWGETVRMPWKNFRRRVRTAMLAGSPGVPVSVDETTRLPVVPFQGRFPPPMAQCTVVEACDYRTKLHSLSVNSRTTERVHYVEHTVHAPPMILEHLVDRYWFPAFGLLISRNGEVWRHSFLGPFREGFLSSVKAIADRRLPDGSLERLFYEHRLARAPRVLGEHLLIAGSDKPNYGHYLHDVVPLIYQGARMGAPMLTWTLRPWQRELMARLHIPPGLIREIAPEPVFLEHAIASNRHSGVSSQNAHPQHKEVFAEILSNVRRQAPAIVTPKRVLVCRSLRNSRNVTNRAEMISALKSFGFTAIQPDTLSFDEQVLTFAAADIIVCEFGAALVNAFFCRPGTKVVEIIAEGQHDPWSSHFGAMLELEHVVLFQPQTEEALASAPRHMKDSPFSYAVDVPKLVETVRALLAE